MDNKAVVETKEWRCFYCDEVFTGEREAALHFGEGNFQSPGCLIKVNSEERSMLSALRKFEAERARYCQEDTDLHRAMYGMQADHEQALRREEEMGYARGLKDAFKYPSDALIPESAAKEYAVNGFVFRVGTRDISVKESFSTGFDEGVTYGLQWARQDAALKQSLAQPPATSEAEAMLAYVLEHGKPGLYQDGYGYPGKGLYATGECKKYPTAQDAIRAAMKGAGS